MESNYNPFAFISSDIVVWNGIITSFGSISPFTEEGDSLRIANESEEKEYKNVP